MTKYVVEFAFIGVVFLIFSLVLTEGFIHATDLEENRLRSETKRFNFSLHGGNQMTNRKLVSLGSISEIEQQNTFPLRESRHHRFHLVRGFWEKQNNEMPVWKDSWLCDKERAPNGCPLKKITEMSNKTRSELSNSWFYFHGDSTMRQIALQFYNQFLTKDVTFLEAKEMFRQCPSQQWRQPYTPPPWDDSSCNLNEKTCTEKLVYGNYTVNWTEDWKHFIYEDYDEWLFTNTFPDLLKKGKKIPDVLVLSTGIHSCYHFEDPKWLPTHFRQIDTFLDVLLNAAVRPPSVILMDAGVHNNARKKKETPPQESICAVKVNHYLQFRVYEILMKEGEKYPWLSFVSRHNITRSAPEELWEDQRRVHLHKSVQKVLLSYVLYEAKKAIIPT